LRVFRPAVWQQRLIVLPQCVQIRQVVGEKSSNLVDVRAKNAGRATLRPAASWLLTSHKTNSRRIPAAGAKRVHRRGNVSLTITEEAKSAPAPITGQRAPPSRLANSTYILLPHFHAWCA
jgi:hypothetical protein